jgi:hypothetical protein
MAVSIIGSLNFSGRYVNLKHQSAFPCSPWIIWMRGPHLIFHISAPGRTFGKWGTIPLIFPSLVLKRPDTVPRTDMVFSMSYELPDFRWQAWKWFNRDLRYGYFSRHIEFGSFQQQLSFLLQ